MGYSLNAIVGKASLLETLQSKLNSARLVVLPQEFALIPITQKLAITYGVEHAEPFYVLTVNLMEIIQGASHHEAIGCFENECFAGVCDQAGVVFDQGKIIVAPTRAERLPILDMPVNVVLRSLGVVRSKARDEFEALNLGRYRNTEEWL